MNRFQRYINQLPREGKMVFFDRSWYNRAIVEPVNGFCTQEEYDTFMSQVNDFERMISESGIRIIKLPYLIGYLSDTFAAGGMASADALAQSLKLGVLVYVIVIVFSVLMKRHLLEDLDTRKERARAAGEPI